MLFVLTLACGPSGTANAKFTIVNQGTGEPLVSKINHAIGTRYTYAVLQSDATDPTKVTVNGLSGDAVYTRKITLDQGPEVLVYSTPLEDVYIEVVPDGELTWGGNTQIASAPILNLKLPLKQDLEWETSDEKGTPFYRFRVEASERIDVPAGTFQTARVLQSNLRQGTSVTRWFAEEVGMVQRNNSVLLRYELNREAP
jgi:hypothetical protein